MLSIKFLSFVTNSVVGYTVLLCGLEYLSSMKTGKYMKDFESFSFTLQYLKISDLNKQTIN